MISQRRDGSRGWNIRLKTVYHSPASEYILLFQRGKKEKQFIRPKHTSPRLEQSR